MLVAKRYRLGPSIGRGGMGEVWRAVDEVLQRPVAVKLLLPNDHDPSAAERFHREARAAARLSDPHVVSVYDFGNHEDGFFLVMELVEGPTAAGELEANDGPLPKDRAIDIVEQAAAGLAAAHREDIVHRDVKPGNLLVAADGTVKVADFGIAHVADQGSATLTATGQIIGSSRFLAPERARGGRAGQPSDVYALGCVLYQLVTGQPPFNADNPTAILYQHVDAVPTPPSVERPELGGAFEQVLLSMLAKDPAERPTAAEIAGGALRARSVGDDWRGLAAGAAGADAPTVAAGAAGAAGLAGATATSPELAGGGAPGDQGPAGGVPPKPSSRTKQLLIGAIAVLATAAAAITGVVLFGDEPSQPPTTDLRPDVTPTPGVNPGTTDPSTSNDPTRTGPTGPATSSQPTQTPSNSPTPTTTPSSTPTPTTSPTVPVQPSNTPSSPTQTTSTPEDTPSSTPPPDTPPPSTPPPNSPTPPDERNSATPQSD
ncbi:serine/threonine-protein kinase [Kribbella sp. DT2]|uniref:serine/threonine-protein kinase n=1 Tax=Kribbella sp. DT2 TaxID=3393427 RepID=UPI003CE8B7A1